MSMLVQPGPLPEEIDRGYLGRIIRINGYRNAKDVVEAMSADYGEGIKSRRELTTHELLSNMAGLTSEEFAQNHTTIPLRRAITSFFPEIRHGSLERRSLLHNGAMQRKYAAAFLCEECVKADIHFHGVSYWRRDHQTQGQLWCQKHEKPLHFSTSVDPLLSSPPIGSRSSAQQMICAWMTFARLPILISHPSAPLLLLCAAMIRHAWDDMKISHPGITISGPSSGETSPESSFRRARQQTAMQQVP